MSFEKGKLNHQTLVQGTSALLITLEYYRASKDLFNTIFYLINIVFKHIKMFNDLNLDMKTITDYYYAEKEKRLLKAKEKEEQSIIFSRAISPSKIIQSVE